MEAAGFPFSGSDRLERRLELLAELERGWKSFAAARPDRVVEVVYERLVCDPRDSVEALMRALGERFEEPQLRLDASATRLDGLGDPKRDDWPSIAADSVGRWRAELGAAELGLISLRLDQVASL